MERYRQHKTRIFASHGDLSEENAIPSSRRVIFSTPCISRGKYELFARTSLPIKVSLTCRRNGNLRPYPADSTLACVVTKYKLGAVCMAGIENDIAGDIRTLLGTGTAGKFCASRKRPNGLAQVQQLGAALRGEDWRHSLNPIAPD